MKNLAVGFKLTIQHMKIELEALKRNTNMLTQEQINLKCHQYLTSQK